MTEVASEYGETSKSSENPPDDCYSYDSDGRVTYTDPQSQLAYILNEAQTDWVLKDNNSKPEQSSTSEKPEYEFDGQTYGYTNADGTKFKWNLETKIWERQENLEGEANSKGMVGIVYLALIEILNSNVNEMELTNTMGGLTWHKLIEQPEHN